MNGMMSKIHQSRLNHHSRRWWLLVKNLQKTSKFLSEHHIPDNVDDTEPGRMWFSFYALVTLLLADSVSNHNTRPHHHYTGRDYRRPFTSVIHFSIFLSFSITLFHIFPTTIFPFPILLTLLVLHFVSKREKNVKLQEAADRGGQSGQNHRHQSVAGDGPNNATEQGAHGPDSGARGEQRTAVVCT